MDRISRDQLIVDITSLVAERSTCTRAHVGAVLTREGRILSTGYVGAPSRIEHCNLETCSPDQPCTRTVHAEANAIAWAARKGISTEGSTLYTTMSPCIECAKLIINAGIDKVIFMERYRDLNPLGLLVASGILIKEWKDGKMKKHWRDE